MMLTGYMYCVKIPLLGQLNKGDRRLQVTEFIMRFLKSRLLRFERMIDKGLTMSTGGL